MEFLKKHYEKIILSVVLVGVVGFLCLLPFQIDQEKQYIQSKRSGITADPKPYTNVVMAPYNDALTQIKNQPPLHLHGDHNTFNPVMWQLKPDNTLYKVVGANAIGPSTLIIEKIDPIYFTLSIERVSGSSYLIASVRDAAVNRNDRMKKTRYISQSSPKAEGNFTLKEVKGDPANPTELVFELADTKELATVAKDKPFKRVDDYFVDMKYPLENKVFTKIRKGETIGFGGDSYKVVDISPDGVVLLAESSQKKIPVKYNKAN